LGGYGKANWGETQQTFIIVMFATRAADRKRIVDLIKFNELIIFINYSGSAVWKKSNEMRAD